MNKQEKKLKTVSTSVKEENVEITQVTANGNVVIHPVTKAQNVKYKNSNLHDVLENKIALDGDGGQNFNFIENKVMPDGLLMCDKILDISTGFKKYTFQECDNFSIGIELNLLKLTNAFFVMIDGTDGGYLGEIAIDGFKLHSFYNGSGKSNTGNAVSGLNYITFSVMNGVVTQTLNGISASYTMKNTKKIGAIRVGQFSGKGTLYGGINIFMYNSPLTQSEIQHNFSVLNNSPSIKELHTTDSTGKTSILKLASDTDHVEDRSGRTQEQINRTFYKRMCKEIPSPSGEPITVKNGEEGYVLSAEIKGNTQLFKRAKGSQDEWIVIPNDEGRDTVAFEYKLDSTQAIISNNGEPYPIYANEEDKANKKVISLNKMGDVSDSLEIKKDGSGVYTSEMMTVEVDKDSISLNSSAQNQILTKYFAITLEQEWLNENKLLSNLFPTTPIWNNDVEGCFLLGGNKLVMGFRILKSKLISDDLDGVKDYLTKNKLTAIYRTKAPTVTHIDKSIMPTILTQQTNILEVGGAVKPSSFKVTVPVDRLAEIEARLQALESTTVDVVLNK